MAHLISGHLLQQPDTYRMFGESLSYMGWGSLALVSPDQFSYFEYGEYATVSEGVDLGLDDDGSLLEDVFDFLGDLFG